MLPCSVVCKFLKLDRVFFFVFMDKHFQNMFRLANTAAGYNRNVNRIIDLNKKLGTNYPLTEAGWNLISKYETFSEKELDDLDPYIEWNTYLTFHPHTFSEKFRKKKADHFTLVELGLISYKGEPGPRPAEYCIVTNSRQRKRTGSS